MAEMSAETPSLQTSSDSWALIDHPSLGRTLRATTAIAAGEVLLAERPALLATPLRSLSKAQRAAFKAAAEDEASATAAPEMAKLRLNSHTATCTVDLRESEG